MVKKPRTVEEKMVIVGLQNNQYTLSILRIKTFWAIFIKLLRGKSEVKGKLWHKIATKTENILIFENYGMLEMKFCISLCKLFSINEKINARGTVSRKLHFS